MKLSQCEALVAIADTGSFTKAARALAVSQSAVSHAIATLEAELGVALMRRDRAGIDFTDVGRRVLDHARAVVEHAEQMRQEAESARAGIAGTIRIGTSQTFAARFLPRLITEFRERFPGLQLQLREGPDRQIAEWLHAHAVDVGIVTLPKKNLTTVPLLQDEMFAVAPVDHPLAAGGRVRVPQLAGVPLVLPVGAVEPMLLAMFRTVGLEPVVAFRVNDLTALLAMVAEGHGVTVLPALALPPLPPRLRSIPFDPPVARRIAIGIRTGAQTMPAVSAFVATAQSLARDDWNGPPDDRLSP